MNIASQAESRSISLLFPVCVSYGGYSHNRCSESSSAAEKLFTSTLPRGKLFKWQIR